MEHSTEEIRWVRRQVTVFHSFDSENGRCFWLTIKADNTMRKRIVRKQIQLDMLQPKVLETLEGSFKSTLATHLFHLDWSSEGWMWYIDDIRFRLQGIIDSVQGERTTNLGMAAPGLNLASETHGDPNATKGQAPLRQSPGVPNASSLFTQRPAQTLRNTWADLNVNNDPALAFRPTRRDTDVEMRRLAVEDQNLKEEVEQIYNLLTPFYVSDKRKHFSFIFRASGDQVDDEAQHQSTGKPTRH
ncbi:hypothetical protein VDGL01_08464 [Verticillium dahliae]